MESTIKQTVVFEGHTLIENAEIKDPMVKIFTNYGCIVPSYYGSESITRISTPRLVANVSKV